MLDGNVGNCQGPLWHRASTISAPLLLVGTATHAQIDPRHQADMRQTPLPNTGRSSAFGIIGREKGCDTAVLLLAWIRLKQLLGVGHNVCTDFSNRIGRNFARWQMSV